MAAVVGTDGMQTKAEGRTDWVLLCYQGKRSWWLMGMEVMIVASGYILKVQPTEFAYGLNEGCKRKSKW